jgi:hypothetical protein
MQYNLKFRHISIRFKDVDAAAEFFINKLGFNKISELKTRRGKKIIVIKKGSLTIELFQTFNEISNNGFLKILGFSVNDIVKTVSKMKKDGVVFTESIKKSKDSSGKRFYFTYFLGPENIKLCLYREIKNGQKS